MKSFLHFIFDDCGLTFLTLTGLPFLSTCTSLSAGSSVFSSGGKNCAKDHSSAVATARPPRPEATGPSRMISRDILDEKKYATRPYSERKRDASSRLISEMTKPGGAA